MHLDTATNQPEAVAFYQARWVPRSRTREPTGVVLDTCLLHQGLLTAELLQRLATATPNDDFSALFRGYTVGDRRKLA